MKEANYEQFAKDLALKAGKIIKDNFSLGMEKEMKGDQTFLTIADTRVNDLVIEEVKKAYPDHNIQGEEQSDMGRDSEYLWVCDPVDGTIMFSHGCPTFAFSLVLVKDGTSIVGVVYDPMSDRLFYAEKDKGTILNGKKTHVSDDGKLEKSALMDIEAFARAQYDLWGLCQALDDRGANALIMGSIVYSGVLVACGEFAASVFPGYTNHDIAALKVIVEEAGGKVTDLFGNEQRYDQKINGAIVSNGKIHNEIVKIVKELGIEKK